MPAQNPLNVAGFEAPHLEEVEKVSTQHLYPNLPLYLRRIVPLARVDLWGQILRRKPNVYDRPPQVQAAG